MHQASYNEVSIIPTALALTQWKGPVEQKSICHTGCRKLCHESDRSFDPGRRGESLSVLSLNNEAIRTQGVKLRKKINLTTLTVRILFSFSFFAFVSSFHILFSDRTAFCILGKDHEHVRFPASTTHLSTVIGTVGWWVAREYTQNKKRKKKFWSIVRAGKNSSQRKGDKRDLVRCCWCRTVDVWAAPLTCGYRPRRPNSNQASRRIQSTEQQSKPHPELKPDTRWKTDLLRWRQEAADEMNLWCGAESDVPLTIGFAGGHLHIISELQLLIKSSSICDVIEFPEWLNGVAARVATLTAKGGKNIHAHVNGGNTDVSPKLAC